MFYPLKTGTVFGGNALFPLRVVYEGRGAAAHGVRDNRSPMQGRAALGEVAPMNQRP